MTEDELRKLTIEVLRDELRRSRTTQLRSMFMELELAQHVDPSVLAKIYSDADDLASHQRSDRADRYQRVAGALWLMVEAANDAHMAGDRDQTTAITSRVMNWFNSFEQVVTTDIGDALGPLLSLIRERNNALWWAQVNGARADTC